jgi:hypothetical protein
MNCPWTDKIIDGHILGELDANADLHLQGCAHCQAEMDELAGFTQAFEQQRAPEGFADRVMDRVLQVGPLLPQGSANPANPLPISPSGRHRARGERFQMEVLVSALCLAVTALVFLFGSDHESKPGENKGNKDPKGQQPSFEFQCPDNLRVGDEVLTEIAVHWPGPGPLDCRLTVEKSATFAARTFSARFAIKAGQSLTRLIRVEAMKAGEETLVVKLESRLGTLAIAKSMRVFSLGCDMELGSMALISNSKPGLATVTRKNLALHPESGRLRGPRKLSLQIIPGLLAEAELTLQFLHNRPHKSLEQLLASMDVQILALEVSEANTGKKGKNGGDEKKTHQGAFFVEQARQDLKKNLERFWTFQNEDKLFALYPGLTADPWLTALALRTLGRLQNLGVIKNTDIEQVAAGLARQQLKSGAFPSRFTNSGDVAVSSVALWSLGSWGHLDVVRTALERGQEWLLSQAAGNLSTYETALLARLWLDQGQTPESPYMARLLRRLKESRRAGLHGRSFWHGQRTLTGTRQDAANSETTGLVTQVLLHAKQQEFVQGALEWLLEQRHPTRGFGGTRAAVEVLTALKLAEDRKPLKVKGQLRALLGDQELLSVDVSNGPGDHLMEFSLSSLNGQDQNLIDRLLATSLRIEYNGIGRFATRLVLTGVAPGMTAEQLLKPLGVIEQGLHVVVEKPARLMAGVEQQWTLELLNRNTVAIQNPMIELDLPAGFKISRERLEELLRASTLRAFESFEGRPVFYIRAIEAGEQLRIPLFVTPTHEGQFWTGVTRAYPYYQPGEENILEPVQMTVEARQDLPAADPKLLTDTRPHSKDTKAPARRSLTPVGTLQGALVIAWDNHSLGEINLDLNQLPFGTKPIDQLITRALFSSLPELAKVKEITPGLEWEFELRDRHWSDGRAISVEDILDSWNRARQLFSNPTKLPRCMDQRQYDLLHEMHVRVLSSMILRVKLPQRCDDFIARLGCVPFLPGSIWSDPQQADTVHSSGPYRLECADTKEIVLVRSGEKGQSKIFIRPVRKGDLAQRGVEESQPEDDEILEKRPADLLWGSPARGEERAGLGLVGVYMSGEAQHSLDLHVALQIVGEIVKDKRKWSHVADRDSWRGRAQGLGRYTNYLQLSYDRESLAEAADTVADELRRQGFSVTVESLPYDGFGEVPEILLSSGWRKTDLSADMSFQSFGRVPSNLGGPLSDIFRHALDRYGFLQFPARGKKKDH